MQSIELRHIRIFIAIYRTRGITQAALRLGLSQPAISIGLGMLRKRFNDALFVRTGSGMMPTPYADHLMHSLESPMLQLDEALGNLETFKPDTSERVFRVSMVDLATVVILPRLLQYLEANSPSVTLEVFPLTSATSAQLEEGQVDVAFGVSPPLQAGFYQKRLYQESLVCIARADHPRVRSDLSLDDYLNEKHMVISPPGSSHWLLEKWLSERRLQRKVGCRVQSFVGVANVVAETEMIATVPKNLGNYFSQVGRIRVVNGPAELPHHVMSLYWHERYQKDQSVLWLRNVIFTLFSR